MNRPFVLEICIDSIESAINAINGGANRLEVCSSLKDDGLTPSHGLLLTIHNYLKEKNLTDKVQIYSMIRPRGGDFVYSRIEINQMIAEINQIKSLGIVSGFVFGILNEDCTLNVEACKLLLNECTEYENTFHRAIDRAEDSIKLLNQIIELGFKRVITSGQGENVFEGIEMIKKLIDTNANRIKLSPASGINDKNLENLICQLDSKTNEYHSSAKVQQKSKMITDKKEIFNYNVSNEEIVRKMVQIGGKYFK